MKHVLCRQGYVGVQAEHPCNLYYSPTVSVILAELKLKLIYLSSSFFRQKGTCRG